VTPSGESLSIFQPLTPNLWLNLSAIIAAARLCKPLANDQTENPSRYSGLTLFFSYFPSIDQNSKEASMTVLEPASLTDLVPTGLIGAIR
jgi:hypothetical protein